MKGDNIYVYKLTYVITMPVEEGMKNDFVEAVQGIAGVNYDFKTVTSEDTGIYDAEMVDTITRLSSIVAFPDIVHSSVDQSLVQRWAFEMQDFYPVQRIDDRFLPTGLDSQFVVTTLNEESTDPTTKVVNFLELANRYGNVVKNRKIDSFIAEALKRELAPQDKKDLVKLYAQLRRRSGYQKIENIPAKGGAVYNANDIYEYKEKYLKPWDAICEQIDK